MEGLDSTAKHEADNEAGGAAKRARLQVQTENSPPVILQWEEIDCGGEGDCAFCVVARACTESTGATVKPEEMKPKGKKVAFLRVQTAKEIRSHAATYAEELVDAEDLANKAEKRGRWQPRVP